ncbi:hypothetical protein VNO77_14863 [Canavalia gladiata]|uniref:Uncharacterized protein n=1 Tax=Canavalia gladiata TaxID=3824 RepID=A0AAN9M264_CANGL
MSRGPSLPHPLATAGAITIAFYPTYKFTDLISRPEDPVADPRIYAEKEKVGFLRDVPNLMPWPSNLMNTSSNDAQRVHLLIGGFKIRTYGGLASYSLRRIREGNAAHSRDYSENIPRDLESPSQLEASLGGRTDSPLKAIKSPQSPISTIGSYGDRSQRLNTESRALCLKEELKSCHRCVVLVPSDSGTLPLALSACCSISATCKAQLLVKPSHHGHGHAYGRRQRHRGTRLESFMYLAPPRCMHLKATYAGNGARKAVFTSSILKVGAYPRLNLWDGQLVEQTKRVGTMCGDPWPLSDLRGHDQFTKPAGFRG